MGQTGAKPALGPADGGSGIVPSRNQSLPANKAQKRRGGGGAGRRFGGGGHRGVLLSLPAPSPIARWGCWDELSDPSPSPRQPVWGGGGFCFHSDKCVSIQHLGQKDPPPPPASPPFLPPRPPSPPPRGLGKKRGQKRHLGFIWVKWHFPGNPARVHPQTQPVRCVSPPPALARGTGWEEEFGALGGAPNACSPPKPLGRGQEGWARPLPWGPASPGVGRAA